MANDFYQDNSYLQAQQEQEHQEHDIWQHECEMYLASEYKQYLEVLAKGE